MGTKLSILLAVVFTLNVVKWFVPNGETPLLTVFLPAKALSTILNGILLCLQIFFRPVGALVMSFPIHRWAGQNPKPTMSQHPVDLNQIYIICTRPNWSCSQLQRAKMSGNSCGMRLQECENGNGSGVTAIGFWFTIYVSRITHRSQLVPCS